MSWINDYISLDESFPREGRETRDLLPRGRSPLCSWGSAFTDVYSLKCLTGKCFAGGCRSIGIVGIVPIVVYYTLKILEYLALFLKSRLYVLIFHVLMEYNLWIIRVIIALEIKKIRVRKARLDSYSIRKNRIILLSNTLYFRKRIIKLILSFKPANNLASNHLKDWISLWKVNKKILA